MNADSNSSAARLEPADDTAYWSTAQAAAAIRSGRISSRDYLELLLDRVERMNPPLNAVVTLDAERARGEADAADRALADGRSLGPLHGVAMTIKDSFQTVGMRTTSGAPELSGHIPAVDAVPVARLRGAGAVIFGKTNLPVYAGDTQSYNEVFGQTNNPWDLERTPGGSSGGSAGALAAGFTPFELGSDIGGSIRGPASTCGVFGHKPSYGIVPALGQIPGPPGTLTQADIAVAGPMARSAEDLELGLDIIAGPDDWHAAGYRLELPPARHETLADYRVAVWFEEPSSPIDDRVLERLESAADALEEAGARVDREARPDFTFDYATRVFGQLLGAAMCGGFSHDEIEELAGRGIREDEEGALAARWASQRHRAWLSANERRLQMRRKWHAFFKEWDAVLLPCLPTTAIPHDHSEPMGARRITVNGERRAYGEQTLWVGLTGVAYLPATVIPAGTAGDGLPVGLQIAGPFLEDRTTLDLARRLSKRIGGFERPPGY
ncbi:MAG: amidase [Acidobacteria bacterium]|nr:amidase [Acidobacteriota bacterium]